MPYIAKKTEFNYESIPAGYYYDVLEKGNNVQKFWHSQKFQYLINIISAEKMPEKPSLVDVGSGPGTFLFMLNEQLPNVICDVKTLFFLAPFYSFLSKKPAKGIMNIENYMKFPGSLLVCICTPLQE